MDGGGGEHGHPSEPAAADMASEGVPRKRQKVELEAGVGADAGTSAGAGAGPSAGAGAGESVAGPGAGAGQKTQKTAKPRQHKQAYNTPETFVGWALDGSPLRQKEVRSYIAKMTEGCATKSERSSKVAYWSTLNLLRRTALTTCRPICRSCWLMNSHCVCGDLPGPLPPVLADPEGHCTAMKCRLRVTVVLSPKEFLRTTNTGRFVPWVLPADARAVVYLHGQGNGKAGYLVDIKHPYTDEDMRVLRESMLSGGPKPSAAGGASAAEGFDFDAAIEDPTTFSYTARCQMRALPFPSRPDGSQMLQFPRVEDVSKWEGEEALEPVLLFPRAGSIHAREFLAKFMESSPHTVPPAAAGADSGSTYASASASAPASASASASSTSFAPPGSSSRGSGAGERGIHLIIVDGTWREARSMAASFRHLPTVHIDVDDHTATLYSSLRKEYVEGRTSTLEAACSALQSLGVHSAVVNRMLNCLRLLNDGYVLQSHQEFARRYFGALTIADSGPFFGRLPRYLIVRIASFLADGVEGWCVGVDSVPSKDTLAKWHAAGISGGAPSAPSGASTPPAVAGAAPTDGPSVAATGDDLPGAPGAASGDEGGPSMKGAPGGRKRWKKPAVGSAGGAVALYGKNYGRPVNPPRYRDMRDTLDVPPALSAFLSTCHGINLELATQLICVSHAWR